MRKNLNHNVFYFKNYIALFTRTKKKFFIKTKTIFKTYLWSEDMCAEVFQ